MTEDNLSPWPLSMYWREELGVMRYTAQAGLSRKKIINPNFVDKKGKIPKNRVFL
jgi:hypothetical protein